MPSQTIHDLYKVALTDPQAQPLILQFTQLIARHVWGVATAYRLGLLSNLTGLANPYPPDVVNHDLFEKGAMTPVKLRIDPLV